MSSEPDDDETYQDLAAQAGAQVEAVAQMEAQAQAPAPVQAQAQAQTQTQASSQSQVGAQAEVQLAELLSTPGYFGNDWWNCPAATQREADFARHAVELSTAAGVRLQRIFSPPSMPTPEAVLQYTESISCWATTSTSTWRSMPLSVFGAHSGASPLASSSSRTRLPAARGNRRIRESRLVRAGHHCPILDCWISAPALSLPSIEK